MGCGLYVIAFRIRRIQSVSFVQPAGETLKPPNDTDDTILSDANTREVTVMFHVSAATKRWLWLAAVLSAPPIVVYSTISLSIHVL